MSTRLIRDDSLLTKPRSDRTRTATAARRVTEVDGSRHIGSQHDGRRDGYMRDQGYAMPRCGSHDVPLDEDSVCRAILAVLDGGLGETTVAADLRDWPARPLRHSLRS